ncbi:MAG: tetratricopeptide repeat protein [Kiritimatiellae bacterium]|nr:tetratricopeptide repeat protein [Kiritimatiellia bacterium]
MSDTKDNNGKAPEVRPIPENLPEELLPLYDWWKDNGKQAIICTVAVVALAAAVAGFRYYRQQKITNANIELRQANTLEELEAAVAKNGGTKAGNGIRLRLAKAYYDAGKYQEALDTYKECISKGVPDGFAEIAELGVAFSLEGLNKTDDAMAAYRAFEKAHAEPRHYLMNQASMGVARMLTVQGKRDEAKKVLENLKAAETGNAGIEMAITKLEGLVDRYQPRAARSLFDAANSAAEKKAAKQPAPEQVAPAAEPGK